MRFCLTGALLPSKRIFRSFPLVFVLSSIAFGQLGIAVATADGFNPVGLWYARLLPTESNPVEFQVRISAQGRGLSANLINGAASEPFTGASWDGQTLTLDLAHYDAKLVAAPKGRDLEGTYVRVVASGTRGFRFSASRTAQAPATMKKPGVSVAGTWAAEIANPGRSSEKATALLTQKGTHVTGTMATASGDYGPLHGTFDGEDLVLTVFNGFFVYRFTAELLPDGRLAGEFRSGTNPPVDWKASRIDTKTAAAPFAAPGVKEPEKPLVFSLPGLDGKSVSSTDPRFSGKALIVTAMGSWCPNCHDEAPVLEALYRKYRARSLEVVALSYEYIDDVERSRRLIRQFAGRHRVSFPIVLAGTTKNAETSPLFSRMDGPRAFPTTLFLNTRHRIVKVHSGFDGPATDRRFKALKKEMDETVRKLLGVDTGELIPPDATSLTVK